MSVSFYNVSTLPKEFDCAICLDQVKSTEPLLAHETVITHLFHKDCLLKWLATKPICPHCRAHALPPPLSTKEWIYINRNKIKKNILKYVITSCIIFALCLGIFALYKFPILMFPVGFLAGRSFKRVNPQVKLFSFNIAGILIFTSLLYGDFLTSRVTNFTIGLTLALSVRRHSRNS